MAAYSQFVGRRVEVKFRAGRDSTPATGVLIADSGKCVFLEEEFPSQGVIRRFRWEIPYPCIVSLNAVARSKRGAPY